ncbi:MAG TPA: response regulator transcription factor [Stellaceae bacterium]|nr:response regulator transcription factor [Stellaceae bacterium]
METIDKDASPNSPDEATPPGARLVLVDDDDSFRESLGLNLIDEGFGVTSFSNGADALAYFESGGSADAILLDWRMPGMNGLEVLRRLRANGASTPVIFLTVLSEDIYEEAALAGGAVDFIDKSRRLPILVKRLNLICEGMRAAPEPPERARGEIMRVGPLELRFDTNRAIWGDHEVDMTLTEFKLVALLVLRAGEDVGYRELYDLVHGKNFVAGYGDEGYRTNVRTFIKRIRKKFRDVDGDFDNIHNYAGFGYRWVADV